MLFKISILLISFTSFTHSPHVGGSFSDNCPFSVISVHVTLLAPLELPTGSLLVPLYLWWCFRERETPTLGHILLLMEGQEPRDLGSSLLLGRGWETPGLVCFGLLGESPGDAWPGLSFASEQVARSHWLLGGSLPVGRGWKSSGLLGSLEWIEMHACCRQLQNKNESACLGSSLATNVAE